MFDPGQSDLKSHKSASLSGVLLKAGGGLFLWGSLVGSGVAVRPSSSSDYNSNTVSPRAAPSSQNTMSHIKSNQIDSVSCFHNKKKTSLPPTALSEVKNIQPIHILKERRLKNTLSQFKAAVIRVSVSKIKQKTT